MSTYYKIKYQDVKAIKEVYISHTNEQKKQRAAQLVLAIFSIAVTAASTTSYKSLLPGRVRTTLTVSTAILAISAFGVFVCIFFDSVAKTRSQLLEFLAPVLKQDFENAIKPAQKLVGATYWNAEMWQEKACFPHFNTVFANGWSDKYTDTEKRAMHQAFMLLAIDQQNWQKYYEAMKPEKFHEMITNCMNLYTLFKGLSTNADYNRENPIFSNTKVIIPKNLFQGKQ
ncbi:MAG: hypothetical protein H7A40_06475 [Chlamydiales bacterium]|nr:hypothetical protein [Chlamydiales bacterium]